MAIWAGRSAVLLPLVAAVLIRDSPPSGMRAVIWQLLGAVTATALSVLATERLQARIRASGTTAQSPQRRLADAVLRSEIAGQASLLPLAVALTGTILAATRAIDSLGFDAAATAFRILMLLILLPLPFISYSAVRQRRQIRQSLTAT